MTFMTSTVKSLQETLDFDEYYINLADMKTIRTSNYNKSYGAGSNINLKNTAIEFNNKTYHPTQRFWTSFCAKVGIGTNIFNLFNHEEVFNRVVEDSKFSNTGNVRVVIDNKTSQLLAITTPAKPIINWYSLLELLNDKNSEKASYCDGIITSTHCLSSDLDIKIGSEDYKQRIAVSIPIDGYGQPSVYLALLRLICQNGMVALSSAFKTNINISKSDNSSNIEYSLERMFDSYSNDEGFDALIKRIDAARKSKLSVREYEAALKLLAKLSGKETIAEEHRRFSNLAGNLNAMYGLSHLQQLTDKQLGLLETNLTVYEAINYLTEVATHRLNDSNKNHIRISNSIHGYIGSLISKPYDLEGIIDQNEIQNEFTPKYYN